MSVGDGDISQFLVDKRARTSAERFNIKSEFAVVAKLCLHWASAKLYTDLPAYEEVALGSVGRIADELALLRPRGDGDFEFVRAGAAVEAKIGKHFPTRAIGDLTHNYRIAFARCVADALAQRRPVLSLARCV